MITKRPSDARGHADHGWLETWHTFSFAQYHDPRHMGFRDLRVINQDIVAPGGGFQTHGHDNMEIVTYVLSGSLSHKDSMGNGSSILPGEVQLMSAGTGVTHSEFNSSDSEPVELLQMWVLPAEQNTEPRYDQKAFPAQEREGKLRLVVAPDGADGALRIGQDTRLYVSTLRAGESVEHALAPGRGAWLHVARGSLRLNGEPFGPGDGAAITDTPSLTFEGLDEAEFVLFDMA